MQIDDLPEGWTRAFIGELCDFNPKHKKKLPDDLPVSFIPMASVSDEFGEIIEWQERPLGEVRKGYTHFAEDDVLWAKITPCMQNGKSAVARKLTNGIGCGTTEFFVLRSKGRVTPEYLHGYMRQIGYRNAAEQAMTGVVGQARVPKSFVLESEIALPPLPEQKRIVARLEALEEQRRAAKEKLDRLPALLEQYRQSVLAAAFRGDLTAAWRAAHPDPEPASVLLDRIRAERRRRWIEATAQTKTERAAARAAKKGQPWNDATFAARLAKERTKAKQKYEAPAPVDASDLPELPDGWCWVRLEEITDLITKGASPRWQGFEYRDSGIPFVRSQNVQWGTLDLEDLAHLDDEFNEHQNRSVLRSGDVLLNIVGASIGRAALATDSIDGGNTNQAVALIRLTNDREHQEYVLLCLLSPMVQRAIHLQKVDVARANFSLTDIGNLAIPLPPAAEQDRIVELVGAALTRIKVLEATVEDQRAALATLHQATLAKAFRGELVPTDAALARERGAPVATPDVPEPAEREEAPPPIVFEKDAAGHFVRVDAAG